LRSELAESEEALEPVDDVEAEELAEPDEDEPVALDDRSETSVWMSV
jgi:hypothetical protein